MGEESRMPSMKTTRENGAPVVEGLANEFTQFQLKEYDNISQAYFKTNEVLATFYRYFLLIIAIPITTVGLALLNFSDADIKQDGRILAFFIFGVSAILLSIIGAAVILYIEKLRLNAVVYARSVNSIRNFFFKLPDANLFGEPVLPTSRFKPPFGGFGASLLLYYVCALMNSAYFGAGILALFLDKSSSLKNLNVEICEWGAGFAGSLVLMVLQVCARGRLITDKTKKGY